MDSALGELLWMFGGSGMGSDVKIPVFAEWLLGAAATVAGLALRIGFLAVAVRLSGTASTLREIVTASNLVGVLPIRACVLAAVLDFFGMWTRPAVVIA